jgi:hypothetical protein
MNKKRRVLFTCLGNLSGSFFTLIDASLKEGLYFDEIFAFHTEHDFMNSKVIPQIKNEVKTYYPNSAFYNHPDKPVFQFTPIALGFDDIHSEKEIYDYQNMLVTKILSVKESYPDSFIYVGSTAGRKSMAQITDRVSMLYNVEETLFGTLDQEKLKSHGVKENDLFRFQDKYPNFDKDHSNFFEVVSGKVNVCHFKSEYLDLIRVPTITQKTLSTLWMFINHSNLCNQEDLDILQRKDLVDGNNLLTPSGDSYKRIIESRESVSNILQHFYYHSLQREEEDDSIDRDLLRKDDFNNTVNYVMVILPIIGAFLITQYELPGSFLIQIIVLILVLIGLFVLKYFTRRIMKRLSRPSTSSKEPKIIAVFDDTSFGSLIKSNGALHITRCKKLPNLDRVPHFVSDNVITNSIVEKEAIHSTLTAGAFTIVKGQSVLLVKRSDSCERKKGTSEYFIATMD